MPKSTIASPPRQTALKILRAIDEDCAYTDVALRQTLAKTDYCRRDRAFITECVYGTVRWQGRIDWLLHHVCRRPLLSLTPWIRNALRLGVYQCLWMDRVPTRAAVNETVSLSRHFGHAGTARLVNGVLRNLMRQHTTYQLPEAETQPALHLAIAHSHPEWLVDRWLQRYGWERTQAICLANNRHGNVTLRTNTMLISPSQLAERLAQEGVASIQFSKLQPDALIARGTQRLDALPSYRDGLFQIQDQAAMLVAPLCNPQPGQRVLDVCAAPGGKTTHLAHLMHDAGTLLACDVSPARLRMLRHHILRFKLSSVLTVAVDATHTLPVRGKFDRILVDAPCSGLGVLRHHPDIKWRKSPDDFAILQTTQLRLLHNQHSLLAHNGRMIYSVCSYEPEETREVVTQFLAAHPDMQLDSMVTDVTGPLVKHLQPSGVLELTPELWHTDGAFVARFRRKSS